MFQMSEFHQKIEKSIMLGELLTQTFIHLICPRPPLTQTYVMQPFDYAY